MECVFKFYEVLAWFLELYPLIFKISIHLLLNSIFTQIEIYRILKFIILVHKYEVLHYR
jgi:hypothetical protein